MVKNFTSYLLDSRIYYNLYFILLNQSDLWLFYSWLWLLLSASRFGFSSKWIMLIVDSFSIQNDSICHENTFFTITYFINNDEWLIFIYYYYSWRRFNLRVTLNFSFSLSLSCKMELIIFLVNEFTEDEFWISENFMRHHESIILVILYHLYHELTELKLKK